MAQDEQPQAAPKPTTIINVDIPGMGVRGFPSLEAARAAAKAASEDRAFQLQGDGPSISGLLKKLLTPEMAGLGGFAVGGPVGAGMAATGASLARNVARGESLDPMEAGEHMALNAAPGMIANAAGRLPSAMASASGSSTGGALIKALGKILGGGAAPTAEELTVGGGLARNGKPLLSSATHNRVGQLAVDAENALTATGAKGAKLLKGGDKADMVRRARQLTEAFDAIGGLRRGTGGVLTPEIAAILKANGLNPKTIADLWSQRAALAGHGALAAGSGAVEGAR